MWKCPQCTRLVPHEVQSCRCGHGGPPAEFTQAGAPDWLLEWEGCFLPHGGGYEGRLPLWERGLGPTAEVLWHKGRGFEPPHSRPVGLSEFAASRLWSILPEASPERLVSVPARSIDGLPFEVAVYRRQPYRGVRAQCNLCDGFDLIRPWEGSAGRPWSELAECAGRAGRPIPPVFRLGFLLLELSWPKDDYPAEQLYGLSCQETKYPRGRRKPSE